MHPEEKLEGRIEEAEFNGWTVKERGKHATLLEKQSFGSLKMHLVILVLTVWWTLGLGNVAYALYKYLRPERMVLRLEDVEEEISTEEGIGAENIKTINVEDPEARVWIEETDDEIEMTHTEEEIGVEDAGEVSVADTEKELSIEELKEEKAKLAEEKRKIREEKARLAKGRMGAEERKEKQRLKEEKAELEERKLKLEEQKEQRRKQAEASKDMREAMRMFRKFF